MKKKMVKWMADAMAVLLVSGLCACGEKQVQSTAPEAATPASGAVSAAPEAAAPALSGTISLAGSTSMEKLCEAMSESFMEAYPNVTVTVEYTGSGAGIESLT